MWKFTKISSNLFLLIVFLAISSNCIFIPITGRVPRCMIVYSVGQAQTVKLDINFPSLPDQQPSQYFQVSWRNTENTQAASETIKNGRFKRELALTQNVIYDLCIKAETPRDYGIVHVEYSANNLFAVNQAEIKVPENLLKSQDVTASYLNAESIEKNLDAFINVQNSKSETHAQIFRKTNKISQRLIQISIVQLVAIVLAGIYQFWTLWNYLKSKHYV